MTVLWTASELPGRTFDPAPDDEDDGPWCGSRTPGLLPEQRDRVHTVTVSEEYL